MELEEVLKLIGAYGKYQVLLWFLMAGMDSWTASWHMLVMTFLGYEPRHHCKVAGNHSFADNMTFPIVEEEGEMKIAKCRMYKNFTVGNETESCSNGWWYDRDVMKSSIVTEWDLVCDNNYLAETSQAVYMAGLFLGGCLMGMLSDRWGRKKIMFACFAGEAVAGVVAAFAPNLYVFIAFRFIVGMFVVGANLTGFIVACELFPSKQRSIFGTLHELQWSIGCIMLPGIAFLFRHFEWRYLQLAISLPSLLTFIGWTIVPESVPWLISKRRLSDAEKILETAAKFNGRKIPKRCLHDSHEKQTKQTISSELMTPLTLFKTPQLRKITVCGSLFWFANVVVYYGLSQNSVNLSGDIYLNFFFMSAVEVPSLALSVFLLYTKGRKYPTGALYLFCGVACIVLPFIPQKTASGTDISWITTAVALVGKFSINASFTMSLVYMVELFPTVIRATGFTFTNIFGRVGGVIYPYILYLNKKEELGHFRLSLPYLIFGAISFGAAVQVLLLPETRGRILPETIEDVESRSAFKKVDKKAVLEVNGRESVLEVNKNSINGKNKENDVNYAGRDNHAYEVTDL